MVYVIGSSRTPGNVRGKGEPLSDDARIESLVSWVDDGGATIELVDKRLDVRRAAAAALELADVVERVRRRHLKRANEEANAALRTLRDLGRP